MQCLGDEQSDWDPDKRGHYPQRLEDEKGSNPNSQRLALPVREKKGQDESGDSQQYIGSTEQRRVVQVKRTPHVASDKFYRITQGERTTAEYERFEGYCRNQEAELGKRSYPDRAELPLSNYFASHSRPRGLQFLGSSQKILSAISTKAKAV